MNNSIIPYGKQNITKEDIDAVVEVLKSDYLTQGPKIKEFENQFAQYIGSKYAVAVSNGTAALHLCTLALGVTEGDKVITSPITFSASANCIRYCGGEVIFSDIDPSNFLIEINKVRALLESSPRGTYSGIIPVDFAGKAVNMEAFRKLADEFGLWIIEDACHAPGSFFTDSSGIRQNCGNGSFAELSIFSFHPVKHITSGEGGMITTNNELLYEKLLKLRTHGITKDTHNYQNSIEFAAGTQEHHSEYPGWYMEMQELGYNYRMTDFQAALGITQLKKANAGLQRRKEIALKYNQAFKNISHIVLPQPELIGEEFFSHAYHLYIIQVENRLEMYNELRKKNIFAQIHYIPVHLMPYYQDLGWKVGDMPFAEAYYKQCLSIPMYPTLSDAEQEYVIETILSLLDKA
jgi:UDP-4-amino-4,6-dideoxy-N-acetyl-beta-L-altrosamine transaminase